MVKRSKIKLEFITNESARNISFKKRKRGVIKKVKELSTLCGVKACAVINSCDNMETEVWPSREGVQEVHSKFMKLEEGRFKKMYNQESYLRERIQKEEKKLMELRKVNREIELRKVMFGLLKEKKIMPHHYSDPNFFQHLHLVIDGSLKELTHRTRNLEASGEPVPPNVDDPFVGDVNHVIIGTEGSVSNPHYHGMNMNVNEQAPRGSNDLVPNQNMNHQEPFQYQTPGNVYDQTQPMFYGSIQGMNMNHQEPFQYQPPGNIYDQFQSSIYGSSQGVNMNGQETFQYQTSRNLYDKTQPRFYGSSEDMYTCLSYDKGQSSNQSPNQNQSFMSLLMDGVQDLANIASMDDNNNGYHQPPITTTNTTTTIDLPASINNNHWPTRFGLD